MRDTKKKNQERGKRGTILNGGDLRRFHCEDDILVKKYMKEVEGHSSRQEH